MTDSEFDALLRRALEDAAWARQERVFAAGLPEPRHTRRYLRWEKKLLADPLGYARRLARPMWQRALRTAAGFLLTFAVLFGAVMAVSPSARAWVVERTVQWMETFTRFRFYGEEARGLSENWRPGYVPEGFEEISADWDEVSGVLLLSYQGMSDGFIDLDCSPARQGIDFIIDNEHSDYQSLEINDRPADLFASNTEGFPSYLLWSSADGETAFVLTSNIAPNEMISIAESAR